jgi:hypothetical protein
MEYALEVSKFEEETEIAWAELGLKDKDMQQHYELEYAKLDQNDRQFVKELLYQYDVLTQEGEQFWAKLAQDGEIADKEIQLEYDKLDQNTKNFLMEYALEVSKFEFEQDVHADEVRLTEAEIQLQYDKLDADKQEHLRNLAFSYYELAQQASQWSEEQKLRAQQLGIEADKVKVSASLQQWETAITAAEFGDFSYLKKLNVNTESYEALWNAELNETLNPKKEDLQTEDDIPEGVVDAYVEQGNGVSDTNPFNQPQKTTPDFVETPAMVTPSTLPNQRKDKANEGKSDVQIAKEESQTASEIKEQQKPEALYERFLNGGQLTAKELETVQKKYGKEMQSAQVLYRRYQSGGTLTAKEREIVEKAYGKNVFNYGDTYGMK